MQPRCRMRVPVVYPASIQSDTGAGEGVLLDLSPAGCRMRSNIALNAGTYLALRIAVAQEPTPVAVEVSVVRWCKDGNFGVEFLRYSQGDRERVTDLVASSTTNRNTCPSCSRDSDAERRRPIIIFRFKDPGHSRPPASRETYLVIRTGLARLARKTGRIGSSILASHACLAHIPTNAKAVDP